MSNSDKQEKTLQSQMLYDALVIFKSIEWVEKEIDSRIKKLDDKNLTVGRLAELENEILGLLKKLNLEEKHMDNYMDKYRKLIAQKKAKNGN
jgi:hypothetical protein